MNSGFLGGYGILRWPKDGHRPIQEQTKGNGRPASELPRKFYWPCRWN